MTVRLQDWLVANAERRPEDAAIVFRDQATSYGELDRTSSRLARALQNAGCIRGDRVALLLHKSPRALCAIFASLKADCIYVPLDPESSSARLAHILQLCECRCLIAEEATAGVLNRLIERQELPYCTRIAWLDGGAELAGGLKAQFAWGDLLSFPDRPLQCVAGRSDPAHIMFTPGSAGAPKGAVITHANVIHLVQWAVEWFGMTRSDSVSGFSPLHCHLSTFDIYCTIAAGAQVHLFPPEIGVLPHRVANFIRKSGLTLWFSGPAVLHQMAKLDVVQRNQFPRLRRLLWSGEKFPAPSLIYWMRRLSQASFVNLYGVTEATVASGFYRVLRPPEEGTLDIPIGAPRDGQTMLVLDENLRPAAPGESGDLYVGGTGLSPGYWRDPERTGAAFRPNPLSAGRFTPDSFGAEAPERIFRTGDLAKIGLDGKIYLLGGADSRIAAGGATIELGEVERAVQSIAWIQDAVVMAVNTGEGGEQICCAYVPLPGAAVTRSMLELELLRVLPALMVPKHWIAFDSLPRNCHGKADHEAIRDQFAPPRTRSAGDG